MTAVATVFVVDDNVAVRTSVRALLESAGLAVETYASGEEFLAAYDPERAGCLVLDIRLRQASGLDLQDELLQRKAPLPIIVLTGHGNVPTSVRALKAGRGRLPAKAGAAHRTLGAHLRRAGERSPGPRVDHRTRRRDRAPRAPHAT